MELIEPTLNYYCIFLQPLHLTATVSEKIKLSAGWRFGLSENASGTVAVIFSTPQVKSSPRMY